MSDRTPGQGDEVPDEDRTQVIPPVTGTDPQAAPAPAPGPAAEDSAVPDSGAPDAVGATGALPEPDPVTEPTPFVDVLLAPEHAPAGDPVVTPVPPVAAPVAAVPVESGRPVATDASPSGQASPSADGSTTPSRERVRTVHVSVADAFTWAWTALTRNVGAIAGGVAIWLLGGFAIVSTLVLVLAAIGLLGARTGEGMSLLEGFGLTVATLVVVAIVLLLQIAVQAAFLRGALELTQGRRLRVADFFQTDHLGRVVAACLVIAGVEILLAIASVIPVFGWIAYPVAVVFLFFVQFTLAFAIDKGLDPLAAIASSVRLVNRNLGTVVVLFLAVWAAHAVGVLLCGVGLLVTVPLALIATACVYRRLLGEPVEA